TSIEGQIAILQKLVSWSNNFVPAFEQNETEAGSVWQIPLNGSYQTSNATLVYSGNLTETFSDIQNLAVPAGTYRVFRVDVSASNLTMLINNTLQNTPISETFTANGQICLEYGTNRMIEMNMQISKSILQNGQTSNDNLSEQLELI